MTKSLAGLTVLIALFMAVDAFRPSGLTSGRALSLFLADSWQWSRSESVLFFWSDPHTLLLYTPIHVFE